MSFSLVVRRAFVMQPDIFLTYDIVAFLLLLVLC